MASDSEPLHSPLISPIEARAFNTLSLWGVPDETAGEAPEVSLNLHIATHPPGLTPGPTTLLGTRSRLGPACNVDYPDCEQNSDIDDPGDDSTTDGSDSESDDFVEYSSPILGTASQKARIRAQKRENARFERRRVEQDTENDRRARANQSGAAANAEQQEQVMERVLEYLDEEGYLAGDFIDWFFDPRSPIGRRRSTDFWHDKSRFERMMHNMTSAKNATPKGRERVREWAKSHIQTRLRKEAAKITKTRCLQSRHREVDESFVFGFRLEDFSNNIEKTCPDTYAILTSLATSTRQERELRKQGGGQGSVKGRKRKVVTSAALSLLREYNQYNNYPQLVTGLFMYSAGLPRQAFGVLSHLGISASYSSLVRTEPRPLANSSTHPTPDSGSEKTKRRCGLLVELSKSCRAAARKAAEDGLFATTYDNVNFQARVSEQRIGHKDTQENGTCATLYRIPSIDESDFALSPLRDRTRAAPPLSIDDLTLTPVEFQLLEDSMLDAVLRVIVLRAGPHFFKYRDLLERDTPASGFQIPAQPTAIHPLPAMNINEGSVDGNIEVIEAIYDELRVREPPQASTMIKLFAGDQLSIAHLRTACSWRIGNETGLNSLEQVVQIPGLFHVAMVAVNMIIESFWSNDKSTTNPSSLSFQNTLLKRKPIVLSSMPPYCTSRDLIMVSLYARILSLLPKVGGVSDIEQYAQKLANFDAGRTDLSASWYRLKKDVKALISRYASTRALAQLNKHHEPDGTSSKTDMVLRHSILFLRDALHLRAFLNAIKRGDSGLVIPILKTWTLAFRGSGHPKYAYEMLVFIHNYTHVWPDPVRNTVLKGLLVNTSGKPNSSIPVDLLQEHMNLLRIYVAHGSNRSWEWLAMISPCANILRRVMHEFHNSLGENQGVKHRAPDLTKDIEILTTSMLEHGIYEEVPDRTFTDDKCMPVDILSKGYGILAHGIPRDSIGEFNAKFVKLQQRAAVPPLVTEPSSDTDNSQAPAALPPDESQGPIQDELELELEDEPLQFDPGNMDIDGFYSDEEVYSDGSVSDIDEYEDS